MNNSVAFIVFGFVLTFWTCSDETTEDLRRVPASTDGAITYRIPAGAHFSTKSSYEMLNLSAMKFTARFDSSAVYQTGQRQNQGDINKLYGMADCGSVHQKNSARFGWRWYENALEIWAYAYVGGHREMSFIKTVGINTTSLYELQFTDSTYTFRVDDSVVSLPRQCREQARGYKLYPYFGGDEAAPHDIRICIQDLESQLP